MHEMLDAENHRKGAARIYGIQLELLNVVLENAFQFPFVMKAVFKHFIVRKNDVLCWLIFL